jgi:phosphoglycerol transferase MdoB-like AlkP superfamily enzyme
MADSIEYFWKYVDSTTQKWPKNRMYLSWKSTSTHTPLILPEKWMKKSYQAFLEKGSDSHLWHNREHLPIDSWLNAVRWTDDTVKDLILGFRERGLENETLFLMYALWYFTNLVTATMAFHF